MKSSNRIFDFLSLPQPIGSYYETGGIQVHGTKLVIC